MKSLRERPYLPPFFSYVGGKRGLIECYPRPKHDVIIEPFAGSAGYACRWGAGRRVILVERFAELAEMWKWLVQASRAEILALPLVGEIPRAGLTALRLPGPARTLLGMNIGFGQTPRSVPSPIAVKNQESQTLRWWTRAHRAAVADSVRWLRKWEVICGDYSEAPDIEATWFIDPPYQRLAKLYRAAVPCYTVLGDWCRRRRGQCVVCEDAAARWMPFEPLPMKRRKRLPPGAERIGSRNQHREGIWVSN